MEKSTQLNHFRYLGLLSFIFVNVLLTEERLLFQVFVLLLEIIQEETFFLFILNVVPVFFAADFILLSCVFLSLTLASLIIRHLLLNDTNSN